MMVSLFSQERIDEMLKNEIIANSLEEGIEIGEFNLLASLVRENIVNSAYAANKLGITVEEFEEKCKNCCALQS